MSLRFIYGRAGSGKSHFFLNDIKARISGGVTKPPILLVPEQFSFQAERNLIRVLGAGGIIKTEVLSFRRMAYRVFNEVGGITFPHINSASKCMVIYRILERMRDSFKIFSKASNQQGFVNTVSDMITEFKRHNVTPENLEVIQQSISDNDLLKEKLKELNSIYLEFENTIRERYRDADDDLTMLSEKIDKTDQFDGAEIWVDQFSGFTPQEYLVIGRLLQKAARVNICLCTDCLADEGSVDHTDAFSPVKTVVNKIIKMAGESNIAIESPVNLKGEPLYRFKDSEEIAHLERYLHAFPYEKYIHKTKDISVFSAVNIYTEIENTARDIINLCRDQGMRYKDIAVVTGNLEIYEKLIAAIFTEYGIPYFIDKKRDITNHPLVQLVLSMFEIFTGNWAYEAVFRYLKTGLTGLCRNDIDTIENYVLACGIKGNRWTQTESWNYRTHWSPEEDTNQENDDNHLLRINSIRQAIVKPLMEFRGKTKGRRKAREICSALYEFLCELGIPDRMENRINEFRKDGQLNLANEYGQVWNIVMEVFDQIVEVIGEESIGIERFSNILSIGFGEYKIGLIPSSLDQVVVGSVERSKNQEIKALYLMGVNDGIFPSSKADEGILSDKDRENLRAAGLEIANDTRTKAFEEQYMVYTALTACSKYLKISFPIADHEGKTLRPSIVISRLRKLFTNLSESSNIVASDSDEECVSLVTQHTPTFHELVTVLRKRAEGQEIKPLWLDVYGWYSRQENWQGKARSAKAALTYTNMVGPMGRERVGKLYGSPVYSSVSRIEKYASCPFSYYVQYGLKAQERKIYKLSPPDIGTFMHTVIERFSRVVSDKDMSWRTLEREWCAKTVSGIVDELLEKIPGMILNSSKRYASLVRRLKRVLTRAVWLIAEHIRRGSFDPIGYEVEFGDGGELPPIKIELASGDVINLTGRIDRIDAFKTEEGTYLRIIDYKSGTKDFSLSDAFYGMQIQLITYLDALQENGFGDLKRPFLPGGMLYFRIDDPLVKGSGKITEEEVEKAIMRQLKMKGLILADVKLVKEMDREIDGSSLIIPARINKGDVLGKSSAASVEQFDILRRYVTRLIENVAGEMLKGDVSIKPYRKKRTTPCQYCSYASVCQFDPALKDNTYNVIHEKEDDEVWKLMDSHCKGGETDG